jgi:hypothetical protein
VTITADVRDARDHQNKHFHWQICAKNMAQALINICSNVQHTIARLRVAATPRKFSVRISTQTMATLTLLVLLRPPRYLNWATTASFHILWSSCIAHPIIRCYTLTYLNYTSDFCIEVTTGSEMNPLTCDRWVWINGGMMTKRGKNRGNPETNLL